MILYSPLTDDFFNPRVPGEGNIKYYLKRFFYNEHIGSCWLYWIKYISPRLLWFEYYCVLCNGNITAALKSYVHGKNALKKSIYRTQAIVDMTHGQCNLMPAYVSVNADHNITYCAHN